MRPDYIIKANGEDITRVVRERFVSLSYTDESGIESDVLELVLADHDPAAPIAKPPTGAELELWIGYAPALVRIGLFVCDEIELAGWPGEMTIRARAAPFDETGAGKTTLQTQKSRSWAKGTKIGALVKKMATEHGMTAAVADVLAGIELPHLVQADESDMHFLIRLAKKYDAVAKAAEGRIIFAKRGTAKSVTGQAMPSVTLAPGDVSRWRVSESKRETAGMVVAYWHAVKQAKRNEVKVGSGEPVRRLKTYYPTQPMALAAARAELDRRERGRVTVSLTCPGRTDLAAEAKLVLAGFREGVAGDWVITRAVHSLDTGGYSTTVEAELPTPGDVPDVEEVAL